MMKMEMIHGIQNFLDARHDWDRLWSQSSSCVAYHRAQALASYVNCFHKNDLFSAIIVKDGNQWVAGTGLIRPQYKNGLLHCGRSASNEWFLQACLLKARHADPIVFDLLNEAFLELNLSQVTLDWLPLEWDVSRELIEVWQSQGRSLWARPRFRTSLLSVPKDWHEFWNVQHKRRKKKFLSIEKKLARPCQIQLRAIEPNQPDFLTWFEEALNIEHRSWKGENGSSILSHPSVAECYRAIFEELASAGFARLYFLMVDQNPVAFDLGYQVKGVYSSQKVSFLPEFAKFCPGQLLNARLLNYLSDQQDVNFIDCVGEANQSTIRWGNDTYLTGRLILSTGSLLNNTRVSFLNQVAHLLGKNQLNDLCPN